MSVLVRGMKMPKSCSECLHCDRNFNDVVLGHISTWMCLVCVKFCQHDMDERRPEWCPLEEVPDECDGGDAH